MASFQHRHYAPIAALLSQLRQGLITPDDMANRFARMFADDNPRFDHQRFMLAVEGTPMGKDADSAGVRRVAGMPYR